MRPFAATDSYPTAYDLPAIGLNVFPPPNYLYRTRLDVICKLVSPVHFDTFLLYCARQTARPCYWILARSGRCLLSFQCLKVDDGSSVCLNGSRLRIVVLSA
ncbi:hypothetical protein GYMLUDRAFT_695420 [Collybiopsis luxurians FD-317 M1]|uniref:Unplaced genomic scaffold GYMLUscaffold_37, whole genome shotgun sequence n=1 Tax=Collybiopsis luxurians FD-317 M1 TaxID=944289 RepID=A0A0D0B4V9_9AGAR|nr:hypothetical protein GYMLUDRAFT_695420 [Collybiopsis luxurians FD-317 M1]